MMKLWQHVMEMGREHGVNPLIFTVLYLIHHPLFWGTMGWLVARVRRRKPVRGVIALATFFWLMPYAYVFIFGKRLPLWVYGVAAVVLAIGGTHVVHEIRARLKARPTTPDEPEDAAAPLSEAGTPLAEAAAERPSTSPPAGSDRQ